MARQPKPWYRKDRKVWCVTINGHRHTLGPLKKVAMERFYALMREPNRTKVQAQGLDALIDLFLEWVQRNRSAATYEWYRWRLQNFIDFHPTLTLEQLKPHHVDVWSTDNPNTSRTTQRNLKRSIKRCLKWCVSQGYLNTSPIAHLEVPGADARDAYITVEEFNALLESIPDPRFADLLIVTYETGCRPQESLRVEGRHVDLKNSRWVFPSSESKGKLMPRVIYLSERAKAITARLMLASPTGPLFHNSNERPWTKDSVGCAFDRLQIRMAKKHIQLQGVVISLTEVADFAKTLNPCRTTQGTVVHKTQADLLAEARRKLMDRRARAVATRYSLYALRHSWATNALKRGVDALTVAIFMGHKDPSTLARTYQHLSHNPAHMLEEARRASPIA